MTDYTIRWWQSGDVDGFLDLYRQVLDADWGREWFDWKYVDNPYADHVPIVVAEHGGALVGARAFFALEMAVDGRRLPTLQPCDTMVAADHRRNGLFTRMTERAIERYRDEEPAFFFNFPNDQSLPGYRKLDWRKVEQLGVHYRIENPGRLAADRTDHAGLTLAGRVLRPIASADTTVRAAARSLPDDVAVQRTPEIPVERLASIYRESPPGGIHAARDETFYGWRFDNPNRRYTTYVAERNGDRAAMVVGLPVGSGVDLVEVTDVLPPSPTADRELQETLLNRIVDDHASADVFAAPSRAFAAETLAQFGFHSGESFPLSLLNTSRTQVARGLDGWELDGVDITDAGNWTHTFAELDSS